ncbi:MAG: DNA polymerase Y family protein, partial [Acidimicrobiia bacterium]|nr:DNA polymerase Y family protein [Acidimicrobiia bacterium]
MMERTLCVWFPDWPLRRPDVLPAEPCQAIDDENLVVAVNKAAAIAGIRIGMRRREAEAVCPTIATIEHDPGAEMARFERVAVAVETLIPRIEVVIPGLILAPVTGAIRYFGGEGPLVDRIAKEVDAVAGQGFRIGLAAGPFAARRAADVATEADPIFVVDDDDAFRASLDVAALESEDIAAVFRWLGIDTLGELAALPREAVVSRFGPEGLQAHRLATGEDRDTRDRMIADDLSIEEKFDPPLENLDQAAFVARGLAHQLLTSPALRGSIPHRIEVEAEAADGAVRNRTWRSADPFDETMLAERVRWQLQAWLDTARLRSGPGIRGGLVRLRVTPADLSDDGRQLALDEDALSVAEAQRAFAQTQAIVGDNEVLQALPQGGRDPGERALWYRWGEPQPTPRLDPQAPWPGRIPAPSPALVPPESYPLEVDWDNGLPVRVRLGSRWVDVVSWAGPWRKVGRWWDG